MGLFWRFDVEISRCSVVYDEVIQSKIEEEKSNLFFIAAVDGTFSEETYRLVQGDCVGCVSESK